MQEKFRDGIIFLLKKETGENPVRARRRETRDTRFSIYTPQYKETPLGNREGEKRSAAVGIFFKRYPKNASAEKMGRNKYFKGEYKL